MAVTSLRSKVLCIHLIVLEKKELEGIYLIQIVKMVHTFTLGVTRTNKWGVEKLFQNSDEAITRELKL